MNGNGVGEAGDVAGGIGVVVGIAMGADMKLLQAASISGVRNKGINVLPKIFISQLPLMFCKEMPNDVCYPSGTPNKYRGAIMFSERILCVS